MKGKESDNGEEENTDYADNGWTEQTGTEYRGEVAFCVSDVIWLQTFTHTLSPKKLISATLYILNVCNKQSAIYISYRQAAGCEGKVLTSHIGHALYMSVWCSLKETCTF